MYMLEVCADVCADSALLSIHHAVCFVMVQAGALVAGVVFALTSDQGKFYISAFCGLVGVATTFLFIPDIGGLDLREGDRRWIKNVEGKGAVITLYLFCICICC